MACGCVPVVFDVDDLPALVKNTGIVVPYGDIKESSLGIEMAMTMDGNPARERARLFSKERKLEKLKIIIGD